MNGGARLAAAAAITVLLISLVSWLTKDKIELSQRNWIASSIGELVPSELHDNQLVDDQFVFQHPALGSDNPQIIYPMFNDGRWAGAAITAIAPDGYTGDIKLLIAIREDHSLLGVRVIKHRETPGLGDDIESSKSDWITSFDDQSLTTLSKDLWTVKKDGGAFDQFTGATITPRAVVLTVYRVLDWHQSSGLVELQQRFEDTQHE